MLKQAVRKRTAQKAICAFFFIIFYDSIIIFLCFQAFFKNLSRYFSSERIVSGSFRHTEKDYAVVNQLLPAVSIA